MILRWGPAEAGIAIAGLAAAAIVIALGFEHIGNLAPCPLCLQQRLAYYAAIPLGIGAALLFASGYRSTARGILLLLALMMLGNAGLGIYHAGAEYGFWPGPATCGGDGDLSGNLLDRLDEVRIVPCDQAAWTLGGISLAGFSALLSLALAGIALFASLRRERQ